MTEPTKGNVGVGVPATAPTGDRWLDDMTRRGVTIHLTRDPETGEVLGCDAPGVKGDAA